MKLPQPLLLIVRYRHIRICGRENTSQSQSRNRTEPGRTRASLTFETPVRRSNYTRVKQWIPGNIKAVDNNLYYNDTGAILSSTACLGLVDNNLYYNDTALGTIITTQVWPLKISGTTGPLDKR